MLNGRICDDYAAHNNARRRGCLPDIGGMALKRAFDPWTQVGWSINQAHEMRLSCKLGLGCPSPYFSLESNHGSGKPLPNPVEIMATHSKALRDT